MPVWSGRINKSEDDSRRIGVPRDIFQLNALAISFGGTPGDGAPMSGGLRIEIPDIPPGSTVNSAILTLIADMASSSEVVNARFFGEKNLNNTPFIDAPDFDSRILNRTTVETEWLNMPQFVAGQPYTIDVTAIIQELLSGGFLAFPGSVVIFFESLNVLISVTPRRVYSWDGASNVVDLTLTPLLTIDYTEPPIPPVEHQLTVQSTPIMGVNFTIS